MGSSVFEMLLTQIEMMFSILASSLFEMREVWSSSKI